MFVLYRCVAYKLAKKLLAIQSDSTWKFLREYISSRSTSTIHAKHLDTGDAAFELRAR